MGAIKFEIKAKAKWCEGRVGSVETAHGVFDTPAFMPVGTQGTVKGLLPGMVRETGAQVVLGNTYHLMLRPGSGLVRKMGGLQRWSGWGGPMLTDSGGFQVFSLGDLNKIGEDGVVFKSHLDGSLVELTPEGSMKVQGDLGADIVMAFDDCPPAWDEGKGPVTQEHVERVKRGCERTVRWLGRCVEAHGKLQGERMKGMGGGVAGVSGVVGGQALFGIVQGGTDLGMRSWCVEGVRGYELEGYAIGGVAVGESFGSMKKVVEHTARLLPVERPRYLMGVGYERDIWMAVQAGVDMFDCVLPTRNGRNGNAFTRGGQIRLRNAKFAEDERVMEEDCDCVACSGGSGGGGESGGTSGGRGGGKSGGFSRSYLRHLFMAGEMLGPMLVTAHNLRYFQRLMLDIRRALVENDRSLVEGKWPVGPE